MRRPGRGQQVREAVRTGPPKVGANRTSCRGSLGGELELPVQLSPASRLPASALRRAPPCVRAGSVVAPPAGLGLGDPAPAAGLLVSSWTSRPEGVQWRASQCSRALPRGPCRVTGVPGPRPALERLACPSPQILCIHLKRFRHEVMYSFKISSHVSFPLEGLDLRPFLAKECTSQVTTYDLLSVICHHGTAGSESGRPAPALAPAPGASVTSPPLPPQAATTSPTART